MTVRSLDVYHFRNFEEHSFAFDGRVIGLVGENGLGKTNILEALYLLSSGVSWRTSSWSDLFGYEDTQMRVSGSVYNDTELISLSVSAVRDNVAATSARARYFVNGIARTRQVYMKQAPSLVFAPEDLSSVTGAPSLRREILDRLLSLVDAQYLYHLRQYQQVLVRRNKVLQGIREQELRVEDVEYWTEKMILHGEYIMSIRTSFFDSLATHSIYGAEYIPNVSRDYAHRVTQNLFKEIASGTSQYGPHKDDVMFLVYKKDAARFASRGQQRSVMVWFLMQQFEYIRSQTGKIPFVLLDDIFSELDAGHRTEMLSFFAEAQLFISGCESEYFREGFDYIHYLPST